MKSLFRFPIFFLSLLLACFLVGPHAGTAIKKSGQKSQHNYNYLNEWDFGTSGTFTRTGAAAGTNTDTLVLYQDSATSAPFAAASLTVRGIAAGVHDMIPDSVKYCVYAKDDAADAITLRSEYQIRWRTDDAVWITIGGNGDLALAGSGAMVLSCFNRPFIPGVDHRIVVHPTTTTDSAVVKWVQLSPFYK